VVTGEVTIIVPHTEFRTLRMHLQPSKSQTFLNRQFIKYTRTLTAESLVVSTTTAR